MKQLKGLVKRNIALFFRDKAMFFTAMVTPMILLILYASFLGETYRKTFSDAFKGLEISDKLLGGCVGGVLTSSLLAVCCVTVSFCSNLLMVQDKVTGARKDIMMTPIKRSTLAWGYFIANLITTLLICYIACGGCFLYLCKLGWYMSFKDVLNFLGDVFLLSLFGCAFSSIINFFLSSQGQISAVGTIVSAGYGFVCGAYMPISQFSKELQQAITFFPGTYGTALLRNHTLRGVFEEISKDKMASMVIKEMKDTWDCNLYFYGKSVSIENMYTVLYIAIVVLLGIYIIINNIKKVYK